MHQDIHVHTYMNLDANNKKSHCNKGVLFNIIFSFKMQLKGIIYRIVAVYNFPVCASKPRLREEKEQNVLCILCYFNQSIDITKRVIKEVTLYFKSKAIYKFSSLKIFILVIKH